MFDAEDPRAAAAAVLLATLAINTRYTWSALPYFPIEFSPMGFGAAGGYYIMTVGLNLAAAIMFKYHMAERSTLGTVGAVCMTLLAFVNGDETAVLRIAHGLIAVTCFSVYIAYIHVNGGPTQWLLVAAAALIAGHIPPVLSIDFYTLLTRGPSAWDAVWEQAQLETPVWVRQFKAMCQWIMITTLFVAMFSTRVKRR